jgi:beta-lactamase superfamily II metal-dependent hydrolase
MSIRATMTLEVLPASYGDCLLLTFPVPRGQWRVLVDTGPDETYPALRARLLKLPKNVQGKRHIDLFVVSHIDHDHIGAAKRLLDDTRLDLSFGDIWFNAPKASVLRGVAEGQGLAEILGAHKTALPWNLAFGGRPVCTPAIGGGVELVGKGLPKLTLLSPTPERLASLFRLWSKELERYRRAEHDQPAQRGALTREPEPSLESLAARRSPGDSSVPNGSSIALLVEHRGVSILLGADAVPDVMAPAIRALIRRRGLGDRLVVDALKLSHHGSKSNLDAVLSDLVQARHHIVSTDNTRFNHPDPEAMARVILANPGTTLWFNYDTQHNRRWGGAELQKKYGFQTKYPQRSSAGITLSLL